MRVQIYSACDKHESAPEWNDYRNDKILSYDIPGLIEEQVSSYLEPVEWDEELEPVAYKSMPVFRYYIDFTTPEQLIEISKATKCRLVFQYNGEESFIMIYDDWIE